MQTGTKREREKPVPAARSESDAHAQSAESTVNDSVIEFSPLGRLPRLDLGIEWESGWREFRSSARHFFSGQRAPKNHELTADSDLRVHWIEGKNSPWAFAAASVWHVIAVALLVLPIWGFLPATAHNLAPPDIEVSFAAPQDLPPIDLRAPAAPAAKPERHATLPPKLVEKEPLAAKGADAFHPRQTILSIPVRITHPRQTLIEPAAPIAPPKIDPQLPNLVQWASNTPAPNPELAIAPSASVPKMRERRTSTAVAPDIANVEKAPGPLNIAASSAVNPAPQMPLAPMSAATAQFRNRRIDGASAPQVNATGGDASLRNVVALSASPAPPAPVVEVPRGNLAARVAISPAGSHRGVPGGANTGVETSSSARTAGGNGSLPASVSVSGSSGRAIASGGGLAATHAAPRLILKPMYSLPEPRMNARKGPADVANLGRNERPEDLFAGKDMQSLNIALPDVTSMSGNWVLNFAQLDESTSPFNRPTGVLNGPVPIRKVDPRYPAEAIRENIEGEVVLYAIIRANGTVDSIQVVRHLDPLLDPEAVAALAQWKFVPATRNGKPVDVEAIVHIPFNYKPPEQ